MNDTGKTREQLIREIQELRQRNAALEQTVHELSATRSRLETMLHTMADGMVIVNPQGEIVYANRAAEKILSLRKDSIIGRYYHERTWRQIDDDGAPYPQDRLPLAVALRDQKIVEGVEHAIIAPNGQVKWLSVYAAPLLDEEGVLYGAVANFTDMTERKQTEKSLQESEERFRAIFEQAAVGIAVAVPDGRIVDTNQKLCEILGYTKEELVQLTVYDITWPEDLQQEIHQVDEVIAGRQQYFSVEKRYRHKTGYPVWGSLFSNPVKDKQGNIRYGIGVIVDISDRKQTEAALQDALAEKEVLLKEVHHRVKNNLQTIHSLLYKHQQYVSDEGAKVALHESMNRVHAIALIHEQLYRSERFTSVNLADYIRHFARYAFQTYRPQDQTVSLCVTVQDLPVSLDLAIPIALVLNELLTNALKYAFPDNRSGEITIECREQQGEITLIVRDNGVGLSDHFDGQSTETLGWYLIYNIMTKQLRGSVEIHRRNPMEVKMRFKKGSSE